MCTVLLNLTLSCRNGRSVRWTRCSVFLKIQTTLQKWHLWFLWSMNTWYPKEIEYKNHSSSRFSVHSATFFDDFVFSFSIVTDETPMCSFPYLAHVSFAEQGNFLRGIWVVLEVQESGFLESNCHIFWEIWKDLLILYTNYRLFLPFTIIPSISHRCFQSSPFFYGGFSGVSGMLPSFA